MRGVTIRDAEVRGRRVDVRIRGGLIEAIGTDLAGPGAVIEARGGALIPGLADHHCHLLATAARRSSVSLAGAATLPEVERRVRGAADRASGWVRATELDETRVGLPDADVLEAVCPGRPLRVQDRTGALWLFNRTGLEMLGGPHDDVLERGKDGRPTGRLWRGDGWLRTRLGGDVPDLSPIGSALTAMGVTHVTDASATNDAASGALLSAARVGGALPQHLTLMSGGALAAPGDASWRVGPVKLLLDERDLPPLDELVARIAAAREQGRVVAAHCATDGELAVMVAALGEIGARPGDRIEHGSMIDAAMIPMLAALGVSVVTQPAFVHDRGDRYRATIPDAHHDDLYRIASLDRAGVPVAASSDAPYASFDPLAGMRAAVDRTTARGAPLGQGERVTHARALSLYLGHPDDPGRRMRRVAVGEPADLCLLHAPLEEALRVLDASLVAATIIGGRIAGGSARPG